MRLRGNCAGPSYSRVPLCTNSDGLLLTSGSQFDPVLMTISDLDDAKFVYEELE